MKIISFIKNKSLNTKNKMLRLFVLGMIIGIITVVAMIFLMFIFEMLSIFVIKNETVHNIIFNIIWFYIIFAFFEVVVSEILILIFIIIIYCDEKPSKIFFFYELSAILWLLSFAVTACFGIPFLGSESTIRWLRMPTIISFFISVVTFISFMIFLSLNSKQRQNQLRKEYIIIN
jgi:hypothetical protein